MRTTALTKAFCRKGLCAVVLHLSVVAGILSLKGCVKEPRETARFKVAGIVFQEDQFFRLIEYGMKAAAEKHNVELLLANSSNSLDREISLVDTYIAGKVDAILISPLSVKSSVTALKRAHDQGISVITYNGFILADFPEYVIESDQTALGTSTGEAARAYIEEKLGGKARVAMIEFISQSLEFGHMRPDGFRSEITQLPEVKIVAEQDAWLAPEAADVVENILTAHPDVDLIWAANEGGTVGAVTGVRNSGRAGQVVVFGTDMSEQIADFLLADDNVLQAVTAQNPFEMGFTALEAAVHVLAGDSLARKEYLPGTLFTRDNPDTVRQYKARLQELSR